MLTSEIISAYLQKVESLIKEDAASKGQKIPQGFERVVSETGGTLSVEHYLKYLVHGRGPGKQPPRDAMLKFVEDNPDMLARVQQIFRGITAKSLAYLIGRKIAREGTDIYSGKKPGIDLAGAVDAAMPEFLENLAYEEALKVANKIVKEAA